LEVFFSFSMILYYMNTVTFAALFSFSGAANCIFGRLFLSFDLGRDDSRMGWCDSDEYDTFDSVERVFRYGSFAADEVFDDIFISIKVDGVRQYIF
jgi:hypothetical protein